MNNGTIKEYKDDILIFEGEYLNGTKNGKAKEYNKKGEIIFEGEYLNGKRWIGNVKEFYENSDRLLYEGEYKEGILKGKGYDEEGEVLFEGEFLDDKILNGKGKEFDDFGKLIFEGEYLNGKRWNGIIYEDKFEKQFQIINGTVNIEQYDEEGRLKFGG